MHKERIRRVADYIENLDTPSSEYTFSDYFDGGEVELPVIFSMKHWLGYMSVEDPKDCGTAGCIAGCVTALFPDAGTSDDIAHNAIQALGLSHGPGMRLFMPGIQLYDYAKITPKMAASVLRDVANGVDPRDAWELHAQDAARDEDEVSSPWVEVE